MGEYKYVLTEEQIKRAIRYFMRREVNTSITYDTECEIIVSSSGTITAKVDRDGDKGEI